MKKLQILILTVLATLTVAYGQPGKITGSVTTSDGQPAAFVNVTLKGTVKGATTDKNGSYVLSNVNPGEYTLVTSYVSLQRKEVTVTVNTGETTQVPKITLEEDATELEEIVIAANSKRSYKADLPSEAIRLSTPLISLPQNIQVIPEQVLRDQQSLDMLESVNRNVSGAIMIEHWGNFARINMRGFKIPAFRNGFNVEMPWGPLTEDLSIVERIEFVKGPAGFMLSSGEPGGFYNVVTKKPNGIQENEVTLTLGSFNTLRGTADIGGRVGESDKLSYRLNVMGSLKGAHRDYEFNNRYTIAPSLRYEINEKTDITFEYIYQYMQMSVVGAAYVFAPDGYGDLPRDFTLAEPNIDPTDIDEHNLFLTVDHNISQNWDVTAKLGYLNYQQIGSSMWPESLDSAGNMIRGLDVWDALNESKLGQVFVNGEVLTGPISHKVLAGIDVGQKDYYADWFQGGPLAGLDTFNIYNPQHGVNSDSIPVFDREQSIRKRASGTYFANQGQRYAAVYLQDEIGFFNDRVRLTLAGRYTNYESTSYGATTDDKVFTPRAGLSVTIFDGTSVYGLYDESFLPQTGADVEGNPFVPVEAVDIEGGIKRNWFNGRWNTSITVFQITKNNVLTGDPENPQFSIQLGQVQSKGVEFDLQGEIVQGLNLILNYANTDVTITDDTDESIIGNRVTGHAKHMTNGWAKYEFSNNFLKGLGLSLGYRYMADRSSWNWGSDNQSELPNYFRLDGGLSWQNEDLTLALNVHNLLDEYLYRGSAYQSYYYWQTEPGINFRLNVAYRF